MKSSRTRQRREAIHVGNGEGATWLHFMETVWIQINTAGSPHKH